MGICGYINFLEAINNRDVIKFAWLLTDAIFQYTETVEDLTPADDTPNDFWMACYDGDTDTVKELAYENPALVTRVDEYNDNRNGFLVACCGGSIDVIKYLAEKDPALINSVDKNNDNGLHLASRQDRMGTMVFLVEELKMDPSVTGRYERNSFLWACWCGNFEMLKYLAEKDPELANSVDKYKYSRTSFLMACYGGKITIVKYLAENYPKLITSVDKNNDNGLHLAIKQNKNEVAKFLVEEFKLNPADEGRHKNNSFMCAYLCKNDAMFEYLAENHPELINIVDKHNSDRNIFLRACSDGRTEIFDYLVGINSELIHSVDKYNDNGVDLTTTKQIMFFLADKLGLEPDDYIHKCLW